MGTDRGGKLIMRFMGRDRRDNAVCVFQVTQAFQDVETDKLVLDILADEDIPAVSAETFSRVTVDSIEIPYDEKILNDLLSKGFAGNADIVFDWSEEES